MKRWFLITTLLAVALLSTMASASADYVYVNLTTTNGTGTWNIPAGVTQIDVLVVGGGGASGYSQNTATRYGGGGGGGGLVYLENYTPATTEISYSVGAGGTAATAWNAIGGNGGNTTFGTLTAVGGGAGGSIGVRNGVNGGSGGGGGVLDAGAGTGGSGIQPDVTGDSGLFGFGNNGASSSSNPYIGGGGGGAGSAASGRTGGSGIVYYGIEYGAGGDANGGLQPDANTGGGATGRSNEGSDAGSDGIIVIRYVAPDVTPPSVSVESPSSNTEFIGADLSVDLNFSVSDDYGVDTCWYSLDDGVTNTTITGCSNTTFNASDGTYDLTVYANDTIGNEASVVVANLTFIGDVDPPVVENGTVPVNGVADDNSLFTVDVFDNYSVSSVTVSFRNPNRETIGPLSMTLDDGEWVYSYRFVLVGDYDSVVFTAEDAAGNTATLSGEAFFINNAPPTSAGGGGGGGGAPSTGVLTESSSASATIVADPDDWVWSSFNQNGKFIITNTGERRHTFTILASSPTLTDRISMGGEPIVTIPIDGTNGPARNAQWVEYSVIGQDLPVGEHEVTFTVVSSQGVVLSTEEVTVRISNSGSESLMSFFSTPVFSVFSSDDPTVKTASFSVGQLVLMGLGVLAFGLFLRRLGGVSL